MIFGGYMPLTCYMMIIVFNLIPDIGISIISRLLDTNSNSIFNVDISDLSLLPFIVALASQIVTP